MSKSDIKKKSVAKLYTEKGAYQKILGGAALDSVGVGLKHILCEAIVLESSTIKTSVIEGAGDAARTYTGAFRIVKMGEVALEKFGDIVGQHCLHVSASGSKLGDSDFIVIGAEDLTIHWDPECLG
jgi:hypothetical protein